MGWHVTGPVAAVLIEGSVRYIEHGGTFKTGDNVDHLAAIGLIEPVEDPNHGDAGGGDSVEPVNLNDLTVGQLREYAAERGVDLGTAAKKADIVDVLATAADAAE